MSMSGVLGIVLTVLLAICNVCVAIWRLLCGIARLVFCGFCGICRAVIVCLAYPLGYIPGATLKSGEIPSVPLNPHEQIVRQYHAAVLETLKCDVYLTVTNQRLIISGYRLTLFGSVRSRINQQVSIASVSGVYTGYTRVTDWWEFGFWFLVLLIGRFAYVALLALKGSLATDNIPIISQLPLFEAVLTRPDMIKDYISGFGWWGVLFLLVSYLLSQRWMFALQLHTAAASTPIALGEGYGRKSALQGLHGLPTPQTEEMVCELGQLVEDIRLNGDNAIARWAAKSKPEGNLQRAKEAILSQ
jgi:hypothetical protein